MTTDAYCYVITCNILVCKLNKLEFLNKKGNIVRGKIRHQDNKDGHWKKNV